MFGERLARRALAVEGRDRSRLFCRGYRDQHVLGCVGFQVAELQFHLVKQPPRAFGAGAILLAPQLGDLQLEVRDHRFGGAGPGLRIGETRLSIGGTLGGKIGLVRCTIPSLADGQMKRPFSNRLA